MSDKKVYGHTHVFEYMREMMRNCASEGEIQGTLVRIERDFDEMVESRDHWKAKALSPTDITRAATRFVRGAIMEPHDWPEPMSDELYALYRALERAVEARREGDV